MHLASAFSMYGSTPPGEEVSSVIDAPPGTKINGRLAAYTDGSPWLLSAGLVFADANLHAARSGS